VAGVFLHYAGTTDAIGGFTTGLWSWPWQPGFVGARIFSQAVSVDLARPDPIKVAASAGVESTVLPLPPAPAALQRLWAGDINAASGTAESNRYGLVVRFLQVP
jgi:hypothetical protein